MRCMGLMACMMHSKLGGARYDRVHRDGDIDSSLIVKCAFFGDGTVNISTRYASHV